MSEEAEGQGRDSSCNEHRILVASAPDNTKVQGNGKRMTKVEVVPCKKVTGDP